MDTPRMRTIDKAAAYFREIDPDTAITKTALRTMVLNKTLPSVKVGAKYLIDLTHIEQYMSSSARIDA